MNILRRVDGADNRHAADAAARKLLHIRLCNAADGHDRNGYRRADGLKRLIAHIIGVILGAGREHRTNAEVICTVLFCQNRLLHGMR